ncbi:MAG: TAXI family TRAP transporter solute-binding subunit [Alphaproteobacteria bacterium]
MSALFRLFIFLSVVLTTLAGADQGYAQDVKFFSIGTGSTSGTYYPIGSIIANAISNPPGSLECDKGGSCGVPGLIARVQSSSGSIVNVKDIASGAVQLALSQADIAYWAYNGSGLFHHDEPNQALRSIANLYPESLHVVVLRYSGIKKITDLVGKRVSLGEEGSGTLVESMAILKAYGLTKDDVTPEYLRPGAASLAMSEGTLDAFFFVAGYPVTAITDLTRSLDIKILPISGKPAENVLTFYPFFTKSVIPAGTYEGVGEVETISIGAQLLVSADIEDDIVYQITTALWHENTRKMLDSGHAKGREIQLKTALDGLAVPLHPGAERYYRENGLLE